MEKDKIIKEGIDLNGDDIGYDGDGITCNDILYTGIGYELFNNGNIRYVAYYKDGFAYGVSKDWYPDGQLEQETELKHGQVNGKKTCWYPSGKVKSVVNYEYGIELEYIEWDEKGNIIKNRVLDQNSTNSRYTYLLKLREWNKGRFDNDLAYVLDKIKNIF